MTNAPHPIPSLRDADARVGRSQRHRNRLEEKINAFWRSADYATLIPPYTSGSFTYAVDRHLFPSSIPILIGEVLYNLRSALDYLVHQLAVLDDGKVHVDLRFPIEDAPSDPAQLAAWTASWDRAPHELLSGINASHKAAIRSFQPFEGCAWTRTLRDLANADAHGLLSITVADAATGTDGNGSGSTQALGYRSSSPVGGQGGKDFQMYFDDGTLVRDTLDDLMHQVANVLERFRPDFP